MQVEERNGNLHSIFGVALNWYYYPLPPLPSPPLPPSLPSVFPSPPSFPPLPPSLPSFFPSPPSSPLLPPPLPSPPSFPPLPSPRLYCRLADGSSKDSALKTPLTDSPSPSAVSMATSASKKTSSSDPLQPKPHPLPPDDAKPRPPQLDDLRVLQLQASLVI